MALKWLILAASERHLIQCCSSSLAVRRLCWAVSRMWVWQWCWWLLALLPGYACFRHNSACVVSLIVSSLLQPLTLQLECGWSHFLFFITMDYTYSPLSNRATEIAKFWMVWVRVTVMAFLRVGELGFWCSEHYFASSHAILVSFANLPFQHTSVKISLKIMTCWSMKHKNAK